MTTQASSIRPDANMDDGHSPTLDSDVNNIESRIRKMAQSQVDSPESSGSASGTTIASTTDGNSDRSSPGDYDESDNINNIIEQNHNDNQMNQVEVNESFKSLAISDSISFSESISNLNGPNSTTPSIRLDHAIETTVTTRDITLASRKPFGIRLKGVQKSIECLECTSTTVGSSDSSDSGVSNLTNLDLVTASSSSSDIKRKFRYDLSIRYCCEGCGEGLRSEQDILKHYDLGMGHTWIRAIRPEAGDHVVRWNWSDTALELPEHHGVCISEEDDLGPAMVGHFIHKEGVVADDWSTFANGRPVYIWPHSNRLSKRRTTDRIVQMLGKTGFHGIYNNCEHLASWAVIGEKKSRQLWALGGGFTAISGLWHIGGYVVGGAWGFALAHGVFIVCKWGGIVYLGSDAADHYWEDITRVATFSSKNGPKRCCICDGKHNVKKGKIVESFINCNHGACRECILKRIENKESLLCPHKDCWEYLPPDMLKVLATPSPEILALEGCRECNTNDDDDSISDCDADSESKSSKSTKSKKKEKKSKKSSKKNKKVSDDDDEEED